jgi:hypothetical protein
MKIQINVLMKLKTISKKKTKGYLKILSEWLQGNNELRTGSGAQSVTGRIGFVCKILEK